MKINSIDEIVHLEILPGGALSPVSKLAKRDKSVAVGAFELGIPVDKDTYRSKTDVKTNHHVAEEGPVVDQVVF